MTEQTIHNHECWGVWDDEGPFHVKADGRTIEEAAVILRDCGGFEDMAIYSINGEIKREEVWDCPFDEEKPCDEPTCRHNHTENVYEFYNAYPNEVCLDDCAFVLLPDMAETNRLQAENKTEIKCPRCQNSEIEAHYKFCTICGLPLSLGGGDNAK